MNNSKVFIGVAILFVIVSASPKLCTETATINWQAVSPPPLSGQEELLGEISPTFKLNDVDYTLWSVASSDGKRIAWAEGKVGKPWIALCNGQRLGPLFERESPPEPPEIFFSEDSRRLLVKGTAYEKGEFKSGEFVALLDGEDQKKDYGILLDAMLSPDGRNLLIVSTNGTFINGQRAGGPVDLGGFAPPKTLAAQLYALFSSGASNRLGYIFQRGQQWIVSMDGQEQIVDDPKISSVSFASYGRFELVVHRSDKRFFIINGSEGPAFDVLGRLVFSSDGKHYAYVGIRGKVSSLSGRGKGTTTLVVDGKELEYPLNIRGNRGDMTTGHISLSSSLHGISDPIFSEDGLHIAYSVGASKINIIRDGQRDPLLFDMSDVELAFSPDGTHWACLGLQERKLVEVRDGTIVGTFESLGKDVYPSALTWSPDGQRTAFVAHNYNLIWVVADGKPSKQYKIRDFKVTKPIFSPNGKHWACIVHNAKVKPGGNYGSLVLIDGAEGKPYDDVVEVGGGKKDKPYYSELNKDSLFFQDDETVVYVAREGRKFYRVTHRLS